MKRRHVAIPLSDNQFHALKQLARSKRMTIGEMLRHLIIPALNGGALGRIGQAGHSQITESREAGGSPQQ